MKKKKIEDEAFLGMPKEAPILSPYEQEAERGVARKKNKALKRDRWLKSLRRRRKRRHSNEQPQ